MKLVSYILPAKIKTAIRSVYNRYFSALLPERTRVYNSVEINSTRLFDSVIPVRHISDKPDYESGISSAIETHVREGDTVVIVGGGWGVTTVKAARRAGRSGAVLVYEGSRKQVVRIEDTIALNGVADRVSLNHALVGPGINVAGASGNANTITPEELPECDVLELDCEGAELEILSNMSIRPRVLIVESHGSYGAPSSAVKEELRRLDYSIQSEEIAEKSSKQHCVENDIYSITAMRE